MQRRLTEFERVDSFPPHSDKGLLLDFQRLKDPCYRDYFIRRNWFWQLRDKLVGKTTFSHQLEDESPLSVRHTYVSTRERKQFRERDKRIATVFNELSRFLVHEISPPTEEFRFNSSWRMENIVILSFAWFLIIFHTIFSFNFLICQLVVLRKHIFVDIDNWESILERFLCNEKLINNISFY